MQAASPHDREKRPEKGGENDGDGTQQQGVSGTDKEEVRISLEYLPDVLNNGQDLKLPF